MIDSLRVGRISQLLSVTAGTLLLASAAQAMPVSSFNLTSDKQCSAASYGDDTTYEVLSTSDVTDDGTGNALDCFGAYPGNEASYTQLTWGGDEWHKVTTFEIGGDISSGSWSYGGDTSDWSSFFVTLKAADDPGWGAWYFEVEADTAFEGDWSVPWTNPSGKPPGISHISLFADKTVPVPEPAPLALLGVGLMMAGFARWTQRRRS